MASTLSARSGFPRQTGLKKKLSAENPAQPIDKSRFGRENPRKSKEFQPTVGAKGLHISAVKFPWLGRRIGKKKSQLGE
jgi:hypothetical protein